MKKAKAPVSKAPVLKSPKVQPKKEKDIVTQDIKTANDQINSDMSALGLESNIPPTIAVAPNKKRVKLDLEKEAEKRNTGKKRLNIVVIGILVILL